MDAGKILVSIRHDGRKVVAVEVRSTRPLASRLFSGRTPEAAVQLAPMLFSLCGRAQGAAAQAAMMAAQGLEVSDVGVLENAIAREAMQEHLWRLLLDWPALLGLAPQQAEFVRWHTALRSSADNAVSAEEIARDWLGIPVETWLAWERVADLESWWHAADSPAARLLHAVAATDAGFASQTVPLLPRETEFQAWWGDDVGESFALLPDWQGKPAETGTLAEYATLPPISEALRKYPSRVLPRVLARMRDVLVLATGKGGSRMSHEGDGRGTGLAVVETARGKLMHRIRLENWNVRDYLIVAPTEWNLHPRGALAAGLVGSDATDATRLLKNARMLMLSLDPCVGYDMEMDEVGCDA